jgi:putative tryptophan/tyrosine transport system substrate-binding protein
MKRRQFIAFLGGAAAWPLPARAQTASVRRVGVIYYGGPFETSIDGLREGLRAAGLEEDRHVALLIRNTKGDWRRPKRRHALWTITSR